MAWPPAVAVRPTEVVTQSAAGVSPGLSSRTVASAGTCATSPARSGWGLPSRVTVGVPASTRNTSSCETVCEAPCAPGGTCVRQAHSSRLPRNGATISEFAADLGVTKQSAAAIVDDLVVSGHVRKEPHPRDRRAQLVRLTEAGVAATEAATGAATAQWEGLRLKFGAEAMEAVARVLEEVGREGTLRPVW